MYLSRVSMNDFVKRCEVKDDFGVVFRELLFAEDHTFSNKNQLADYLIGKYKLTYAHFEDMFGKLEFNKDAPQEGARLSNFQYNAWDVVIDAKANTDKDAVLDLLKHADSLMAKIGHSELCYGKVIVTSTIKGGAAGTLAFYSIAADLIQLRATRRNYTPMNIIEFVHELGHRFINHNPQWKRAIQQCYNDNVRPMRLTSDEVKPGDVLFDDKVRYTVLRRELNRYVVRDTANEKMYAITPSSVYNGRLKVEGKPSIAAPNTKSFFPTIYAVGDPEEMFCELFARYAVGDVDEPAKSWMKGVVG